MPGDLRSARHVPAQPYLTASATQWLCHRSATGWGLRLPSDETGGSATTRRAHRFRPVSRPALSAVTGGQPAAALPTAPPPGRPAPPPPGETQPEPKRHLLTPASHHPTSASAPTGTASHPTSASPAAPIATPGARRRHQLMETMATLRPPRPGMELPGGGDDDCKRPAFMAPQVRRLGAPNCCCCACQ